MYINQGCIFLSRFWFLFPPCLWFSSPRRVASSFYIHDFLPHIAIKLCIKGLNSVKLCFTNWVLWFGTVKSYIFPKFPFFLFFLPVISFPISRPFDFFSPPHQGGENSRYTGLLFKAHSNINPDKGYTFLEKKNHNNIPRNTVFTAKTAFF